MIRILHSIDTTGPGGAETVFINLVKGLDKNQFHSIVAIKGPGWVCDTLRNNGIEPLFIPAKGSFNLRYLFSLIRIVREHKIDVIQSHLLGSNLYCSLAGLICRVPVVSTFHGFVDTSDSERFLKTKFSLINRGSRNIVFVSDRLREHYVSRFKVDPDKALTIYNGVDTDVFTPQREDTLRNKLGIGPNHILIGALGNIRPAKGYDVFLRAARLVYDQCPEARFLIAGQGSGELYESLLQLRKELGLEDVFFLIGFQNNAAKVLNNLDIFVLPSTSEGFSISTIEAMSCGLPVFVTRSGGPEEIVEDGATGFLFSPNSVDELVKSLLNYINNDKKFTILIQNGKIKINESYSLNSMIELYSYVYK